MPWTALTAAESFLGQAAQQHFNTVFEGPTIKIGEEIDPKLEWRPTIHFKINDFLIIAAEVSDAPYPKIFRVRHANIMSLQIPIAMYSICHEDSFLDKSNQKEVKELEEHGFGLFTVDANGIVTRRIDCIPLIQHISIAELLEEIKTLPPKYRVQIKDCYEVYNKKAISGLQEITAIVEGLVNTAAAKAVKKKWLPKSILKKTSPASILDDMSGAMEFQNGMAGIGGARSYIKQYRNLAHHSTKTRLQAYNKYRACRHGFIEGIRQILSFKTAMRSVGIHI